MGRGGRGAVVAYAVTGRAGEQGFLQRLAVDPAQHRAGWGRALVTDGLRWLRRHGVTRTLVNTQLENEAALALYRSCGFSELPVGLTVLARAL
jgi:ribosomal protein S18 acetylase RimI-like enzyme